MRDVVGRFINANSHCHFTTHGVAHTCDYSNPRLTIRIEAYPSTFFLAVDLTKTCILPDSPRYPIKYQVTLHAKCYALEEMMLKTGKPHLLLMLSLKLLGQDPTKDQEYRH